MTRTIVAFGDSISQSSRFPVEERWTTLLQARLRAEGRDVNVVNSGVGGNTTGQGLERIESAVIAHAPDLVTIEFGYNDCHIVEGTAARTSEADFRTNQHRIARIIRECTGAQMVFIANHPTLIMDIKTNGRSYEANSRVYNAITRDVARIEGVPLLDLHARFGRRGTPLGALLIEDAIHLSREGEAEYAAHVGDFLIEHALI